MKARGTGSSKMAPTSRKTHWMDVPPQASFRLPDLTGEVTDHTVPQKGSPMAMTVSVTDLQRQRTQAAPISNQQSRWLISTGT